MKQRNPPAIDAFLAPISGVSREGQPLSYNRAPAPDLEPWIARLYATVVGAPEDYLLECSLFNDTANIRIQLKGNWTAQTSEGLVTGGRRSLLFGSHTKCMPVTVQGSFISVGVALRPGALFALANLKAAHYLDRICDSDEIAFCEEAVLGVLDSGEENPEEWLLRVEDGLRQMVDAAAGRLPDPVSARFEEAAFADPSISVAEFARDCGIEQRTFGRIITRDFGLPPKQVLRRARALDMASHLRGVADLAEADEIQLRYYDQSHLIREFIELFGMSPRQFVGRPLPLLTLTLESRQARRLEAMDRLAPGAQRPWQ